MVPVRVFSPLVHTWISILHSLSFWKRPRHKILTRFLLTSANKCKYSKIDFLHLYQLNFFHLKFLFCLQFSFGFFYWFGRIFVILMFDVRAYCCNCECFRFCLELRLVQWTFYFVGIVSLFQVFRFNLIEFQYSIQFQFFLFRQIFFLVCISDFNLISTSF